MTPGRTPRVARRGPLSTFMLACFAVGMFLMLAFDATITRTAGMTALIAFMVSGLFLVADPATLDAEDHERPNGEGGGGDTRQPPTPARGAPSRGGR